MCEGPAVCLMKAAAAAAGRQAGFERVLQPLLMPARLCLAVLARRLVTPTPPDPRREALPVRMSMVEVERALEHVAATEEAAAAAPGAGGPPDEGAVEAREQQGLFAYRLAVVRSPCCCPWGVAGMLRRINADEKPAPAAACSWPPHHHYCLLPRRHTKTRASSSDATAACWPSAAASGPTCGEGCGEQLAGEWHV